MEWLAKSNQGGIETELLDDDSWDRDAAKSNQGGIETNTSRPPSPCMYTAKSNQGGIETSPPGDCVALQAQGKIEPRWD